MLKRLMQLFTINPQPAQTAEMAPHDLQKDIERVNFEDIYEAKELAQHIKYSFVATIGGQRWRVYPGRKSAKLINR